MRRRADAGFALVMAMLAAGLFAGLSLFVVRANLGDAAVVQARLERARLDAAADAGLMMALHGLGMGERANRWSMDGTARQIRFDGLMLTIAVEDERGKVPINSADEDTVRRLLAGAGVQGRQLDGLVAAILDWIDVDNNTRLNGAEAAAYAALGAEVAPRNGKIRTIDELRHIRGMTPDILARIAPSLTLFFGEPGTFNKKTATPLAAMAMLGVSKHSVEVLAREKDRDGGAKAALEITDDPSPVGRPLTIRVQAESPTGGRVVHVTVAQLTGNRARPFRVRAHRQEM